MVSNGLFITLQDERSLALYLREGVFSQHMDPQVTDDVHHSSSHYKIVADYACARPGTHVFFFRKRRIYYGGQVIGDAGDNVGAFYINGKTSPLGRAIDAPLVWDESHRDDYQQSSVKDIDDIGDGDNNTPLEEADIPEDTKGLFKVSTQSDPDVQAQPFLLRFDTDVEYAKRFIRSDDLYFELGQIPYPLKSNTIRGVGFCPMGPGETEQLLSQMEESDNRYNLDEVAVDVPDITLDTDRAKPFTTDVGIDDVKDEHLTSEAHLEASVIANPKLLPETLRPGDRAIVRQAPISPLKPMQVDEVDICYYGSDFEDGMYPKMILELKYTKADDSEESSDAEQIVRYRNAVDKMAAHYLDEDTVGDDIQVGMYAPKYSDKFWTTIDAETHDRIDFRQFEETPEIPTYQETVI